MRDTAWHTSTYSDSSGGNCVEVAEGATTAVRDTQNRGHAQLAFPAAEWEAFLASL